MEITNQAQLSFNNRIINSNIAVGEILEALTVTKNAVSTAYTRDDKVTYVISLVNSGSTALTGVSVSDNLGGYQFNGTTVYPLSYVDGSVRYYINGVYQAAAPAVTVGPPLVISGITVPAEGNATVIYEADITGFAPLGADGTVTNTATVTGNGIPTAVSADSTVTASASPDLTITKSVSPVPVTENSRLTYTFVIQNYGNTAADATDSVSITDVFDPILSDLFVTLDGATLTSPTDYTYTEGNGTFTTVPGRITVPAATFTVDPTTGNTVITPGVATLTVSGTV